MSDEQKPLTDEELAECERVLRAVVGGADLVREGQAAGRIEGDLPWPALAHEAAEAGVRLVAEVRRLRAPIPAAEAMAVIERNLRDLERRVPGSLRVEAAYVDGRPIPYAGLLAELVRVRSDEWLLAAAVEIYDRSERLSRTIDHEAERSIVEILKRHRDGAP
jgi:hypothetical protein